MKTETEKAELTGTEDIEGRIQAVGAALSSFPTPAALDQYIAHFRKNKTYDGGARLRFRLKENAPAYLDEATSALCEFLSETGAEEKVGTGPRTKTERRIAGRVYGRGDDCGDAEW